MCHFCAFQPQGERGRTEHLLPLEVSRRPHCSQSLSDSRVQARMLITTSFLNWSLGGSSSLPFDYLRAILREPGRIKQCCCAHYYGPSLGSNESLENRPFYSVCLSLNCSPAPQAWIDCAYLCLVMSQPVYHFCGPGIGSADGLAGAMAPPTNLSYLLRPVLNKPLTLFGIVDVRPVWWATGVSVSCECLDLDLGTGSVIVFFNQGSCTHSNNK